MKFFNLKAEAKAALQDTKGTTLVEFAFVFPIFVTLVLGLFYLGLGFFGIHQAQATTDRVARLAYTMDDPTAAQIEALIANELGIVLGGTFTPNVVLTDKYGQTYATISILYEYLPSIPLLPDLAYRTNVSSEILVRDLP